MKINGYQHTLLRELAEMVESQRREKEEMRARHAKTRRFLKVHNKNFERIAMRERDEARKRRFTELAEMVKECRNPLGMKSPIPMSRIADALGVVTTVPVKKYLESDVSNRYRERHNISTDPPAPKMDELEVARLERLEKALGELQRVRDRAQEQHENPVNLAHRNAVFDLVHKYFVAARQEGANRRQLAEALRDTPSWSRMQKHWNYYPNLNGPAYKNMRKGNK